MSRYILASSTADEVAVKEEQQTSDGLIAEALSTDLSRTSGSLPGGNIVQYTQRMGEIDRLGENLSEIAQFRLDEVEDLSSCTFINLHCNRLQLLQGLPYKRLPNLTELNLSSNDFVFCRLPELSHLPALRILDLSANKLQSVVDLPFLPGLQTLSIAYNLISRLDGLEENVPNIIKLDVS